METVKTDIDINVVEKALMNLKSVADNLGYGTGECINDNLVMLLNGLNPNESSSISDAFIQANHNDLISNATYDDMHELTALAFDIIMNGDFDKKQVRDAIIKVINDVKTIIK